MPAERRHDANHETSAKTSPELAKTIRLATVRRAVINLLRCEPSKTSLKQKHLETLMNQPAAKPCSQLNVS